MNRYFTATVFGLYCCLSACNQTQNVSEEEQLIVHQDTIPFKLKKVKFLTLSSESQKALEGVEPYQTLNVFLDSLNTISPANNIERYQKLYSYSLYLQEMLPKTLKTAPITARLKVLTTQAGMIQQRYDKAIPTAKTIEHDNQILATAYNNLVIQFNELHLQIPDNIAKELLQDTKTSGDSIPSLRPLE